jgi:taurine transport system permease protein
MDLIRQLARETWLVLTTVAGVVPWLIFYVLLILLCYVIWRQISRLFRPKGDFGALKTVTFGDESAVTSNFAASVISVVLIFLLWGAFTGSRLVPSFLHAPGPFTGDGTFTYISEGPDGAMDEGTVTVRVFPFGTEPEVPVVEPGPGFAKDDALVVAAYRSELLKAQDNDEVTEDAGAKVVSVNGMSIEPEGPAVDVGFAAVSMTAKGTLNVTPDKGWQMEKIWLPAPEDVWARFVEISRDGFRNSTLAEHLGYSLFRVVVGFLLGAIIGIPLGYAMGLSAWFRGWFDPIVEFMRPVPPLALIPLVIIWAGIGEVGKIVLLFLAALWIMAIAARAGVSGVRITKVHAAYSLGASRPQIMRHVIIPNSLPEIFTGARVAMGVCWGTVVAAELVAAEKGAGMMIMTASKFQNTDIVIMGIILIGVIGFSIDLLMRWAERVLVPWKGKA